VKSIAGWGQLPSGVGFDVGGSLAWSRAAAHVASGLESNAEGRAVVPRAPRPSAGSGCAPPNDPPRHPADDPRRGPQPPGVGVIHSRPKSPWLKGSF
jgi:hypothetical protein